MQGTKEDAVALKAKKGKTIIDLSLRSKDNHDDIKASLLVKDFTGTYSSQKRARNYYGTSEDNSTIR